MPFQAQFSHGGPTMEDHVPTGNITGGSIVVVGDRLHIAHNDIPAGRMGALAARHGVYTCPKATTGGSAILKGKLVYWDATNGVVTTTSSGNKVLGESVDFDTADSDPLINVLHAPA